MCEPEPQNSLSAILADLTERLDRLEIKIDQLLRSQHLVIAAYRQEPPEPLPVWNKPEAKRHKQPWE